MKTKLLEGSWSGEIVKLVLTLGIPTNNSYMLKLYIDLLKQTAQITSTSKLTNWVSPPESNQEGGLRFGGEEEPVITILAEEVKDPVKNVPRGLAVSFAVLIVTMMATNFAYYVVLSKDEALSSDAVAVVSRTLNSQL
ncbi:large neutral amino acids transporter small subunit 2-like protein [Plakobranchus ocellatus]|uniref:Large neutral amino acids transporter small subunit 2-like protein n=1 Tax=Plakobranchus ocellatus TaxID=259542 RepID=A0AAV4BXQ6_9GAST|nr:large neutral amino acids transporter small subunit 2-like protein [Plakobranchus ocellatus]